MAKTVYTVEEIELSDGQVVPLKPLNIYNLRTFQSTLAKVYESKDEMETLGYLMDLTAICLKEALPEFAENRELMEQVLDMETVYYIIEKVGGVKFNDPNLMAAAAALA